ncbi:MAG: hypothetical protein AAFZ63_12750 [Bacteroidota bacterium]
MEKLIPYLSAFVMLLGFSSCNTTTQNDAGDNLVAEANQRLNSINEQWKQQTIELAQVLENPEITIPKNGGYTIMAYYDADCSTCISDLKSWQKTFIPYFQEVDATTDFKFVLVTDNRKQLAYKLEQVGLPDEYIVVDEKKAFIKTFDFADEKPFNTFLLGPNQEVVFIGSPLISDNLKRYYASSIAG